MIPDFFTARDLVNDKTPADPEFIPFMGMDGFIERGATHLLTSDARLGKTTVLTQALPWFVSAGESVLYVSEEGRKQWITRIKRLVEANPRFNVDAVRFLRARSVEPDKLLKVIADSDESIVIADTLRGLLLPDNENDNSEMGKLIVPWVGVFQDSERTLIMTHHMNKGRTRDRGRGLSIAGAGSIVSHFDNHLEMWERGDKKPGREITTFGRLMDENFEMSWEWKDNGICNVIGGAQAKGSTAEKVIMTILSDGELRDVSEIERKLGDLEVDMSTEGIRKALLRLARRGDAYRDPPIDGEQRRGQKLMWGARHIAALI